MSDLISRQQACDEIEDLADFYNREVHRPEIANGILAARARLTDQQHIPSVDAVPVVRCKECIHAHLKCQECDVLPQELTITPNFYCPLGKRKDGEK